MPGCILRSASLSSHCQPVNLFCLVSQITCRLVPSRIHPNHSNDHHCHLRCQVGGWWWFALTLIFYQESFWTQFFLLSLLDNCCFRLTGHHHHHLILLHPHSTWFPRTIALGTVLLVAYLIDRNPLTTPKQK